MANRYIGERTIYRSYTYYRKNRVMSNRVMPIPKTIQGQFIWVFIYRYQIFPFLEFSGLSIWLPRIMVPTISGFVVSLGIFLGCILQKLALFSFLDLLWEGKKFSEQSIWIPRVIVIVQILYGCLASLVIYIGGILQRLASFLFFALLWRGKIANANKAPKTPDFPIF